MSGDAPAGSPVCCPHCAATDAVRWQVAAKGVRYLCPCCGDYRMAIAVERRLDRPVPPRTAGRFMTNGDGIRWLLAE